MSDIVRGVRILTNLSINTFLTSGIFIYSEKQSSCSIESNILKIHNVFKDYDYTLFKIYKNVFQIYTKLQEKEKTIYNQISSSDIWVGEPTEITCNNNQSFKSTLYINPFYIKINC